MALDARALRGPGGLCAPAHAGYLDELRKQIAGAGDAVELWHENDRPAGAARVRLDGSEREVTLDLTRPQALDHDYASTSYSSQGRTVDHAARAAAPSRPRP